MLEIQPSKFRKYDVEVSASTKLPLEFIMSLAIVYDGVWTVTLSETISLPSNRHRFRTFFASSVCCLSQNYRV